MDQRFFRLLFVLAEQIVALGAPRILVVLMILVVLIPHTETHQYVGGSVDPG